MNLVRPITRHDIKGAALYAPIRDDYRNRVIAMKQHRRVILGDRVEIVFDNRLILTLQIEETIRLENLTRDDQIEDEIKLANELMPTQDSLAATLFIPMPPGGDAKEILGQMVGLDEHVILREVSFTLQTLPATLSDRPGDRASNAGLTAMRSATSTVSPAWRSTVAAAPMILTSTPAVLNIAALVRDSDTVSRNPGWPGGARAGESPIRAWSEPTSPAPDGAAPGPSYFPTAGSSGSRLRPWPRAPAVQRVRTGTGDRGPAPPVVPRVCPFPARRPGPSTRRCRSITSSS